MYIVLRPEMFSGRGEFSARRMLLGVWGRSLGLRLQRSAILVILLQQLKIELIIVTRLIFQSFKCDILAIILLQILLVTDLRASGVRA